MTKAAIRTASRTPFAVLLIATLLVTTVWLRFRPLDSAAIFGWVSTNVHNLRHAPIRSLVLSALFLPGRDWVRTALMLSAALIPLERRFGTVRTLSVFASAHVIATLLTEGWEYLAVHAGDLPRSTIFQEDVGVSYGMYGAMAAACFLLPRRWRAVVTAALTFYVGVPFVLDPGMTTSGHVLSVSIGLAWWPVLASALARRRSAAGQAQGQRGAANTPGGKAPLVTTVREMLLPSSISRSVRSLPSLSQGARAIRSVRSSIAARSS